MLISHPIGQSTTKVTKVTGMYTRTWTAGMLDRRILPLSFFPLANFPLPLKPTAALLFLLSVRYGRIASSLSSFKIALVFLIKRMRQSEISTYGQNDRVASLICCLVWYLDSLSHQSWRCAEKQIGSFSVTTSCFFFLFVSSYLLL